MSDAFSEIVVVTASIAVGMPLPVTAAQILWINLISDGFPDIALTVEPKREQIMNERPRDPKEPLVTSWMTRLIFIVSLASSFVTFVSFVLVYRKSGDLALARSVAFLILGLDSLVCVFSIRTLLLPFSPSHFLENRWLVAAVLGGLVLQIFAVSCSTCKEFFEFIRFFLFIIGCYLLGFLF